MVVPTSQFTVAVEPTAAVASVPSFPTMAVSMYCTAVCISSSSMVGHARRSTEGSSAGSKPRRSLVDVSATTIPPDQEYRLYSITDPPGRSTGDGHRKRNSPRALPSGNGFLFSVR